MVWRFLLLVKSVWFPEESIAREPESLECIMILDGKSITRGFSGHPQPVPHTKVGCPMTTNDVSHEPCFLTWLRK